MSRFLWFTVYICMWERLKATGSLNLGQIFFTSYNQHGFYNLKMQAITSSIVHI